MEKSTPSEGLRAEAWRWPASASPAFGVSTGGVCHSSVTLTGAGAGGCGPRGFIANTMTSPPTMATPTDESKERLDLLELRGAPSSMGAVADTGRMGLCASGRACCAPCSRDWTS
jgi:hypothetical protein